MKRLIKLWPFLLLFYLGFSAGQIVSNLEVSHVAVVRQKERNVATDKYYIQFELSDPSGEAGPWRKMEVTREVWANVRYDQLVMVTTNVFGEYQNVYQPKVEVR